MSKYYILIDKEIHEASLMEWAEWMENSKEAIVSKSQMVVSMRGKKLGNINVSTVFLGLDYSFNSDSEPVLFETMVFGGEMDQEMDRCCTYEGAIKMHELMCEKVKNH